jgi:hypothetical protein
MADIEKVNNILAADVIRQAYKTRLPLMIWGPPGSGKSATVRQVTTEDNLEMIDLRLVQLDQLDLRGLPKVKVNDEEMDVMTFVASDILPRKGNGILFLDEIVQASTAVVNSASELILDRTIGKYKLPDGWSIVAAGNERKHRAGVNEMPSQIKNRMVHVELIPEAPPWIKHAIKMGYDQSVIRYIQANHGSLYQFSSDKIAYPTFRTWEYVSRIVQSGAKGKVLRAMVVGSVGEAMGQDFISWIETNTMLPSYEDVVADPLNVPIPKKAALRMRMAELVVAEAKTNDVMAVLSFFDRVSKDYPDLNAYIASLLATDSAFSRNPTVASWRNATTAAA